MRIIVGILKTVDLNPWKLSWLPLPRNYVRLKMEIKTCLCCFLFHLPKISGGWWHLFDVSIKTLNPN